jgi:hypothetical protein
LEGRTIMPLLKNVPVAMTAEEVVASRGRREVRPELLQDAQQAIALGHTLWQPQAVYDWFDVRAVLGENVHLAHPTLAGVEALLHVGPRANLLQGAQRALVSVGTLGPDLGQQVDDLQAAGQLLKSFLLDNAGVLALGAVGASLRCLAEEEAAAHAWGVSEALAPGSLVGWQLRGQRELCSLLPLDAIGVQLNEYCVLQPQKSFSVLIGLGPGYTQTKVGSACKYCALQHTCWRRREDPS